MLNKLIKLGKEEIVRGSLVLFVMINIFNFLNYVFHFSMARLLGPADYGVLAVLMSLVYIFSIPAESIQTIISRYTTEFNIKKRYGEIKYLLVKSMEKTIFFGILLFLIYLPISFFLSYFTDIEVGLIIFTGFLIFGGFLISILRGIMQGRKKFKSFGLSMIIESTLKLIIAILLVLFGLKTYGAMGGVITGVLITLLISFSFIRDVINSKIKRTKIRGIYAYSFPVTMVILTITLMMSLDIIFAKRFFPSEIAGKYAVASMLGKMIFFGTMAISKAMFPLTSESYDKGNKTKDIFKQAFFLIVGICSLSVIIYWFFPKLIITILFGKQYVEISYILGFIALAFSFISLSNLLLTYALSIKKRKISWFFLFIFLEIAIFSILHADLMEFSIAFMIINFIMFAASLIFIVKRRKV